MLGESERHSGILLHSLRGPNVLWSVALQLAYYPFSRVFVANFRFLERSNLCEAHNLLRMLINSLLECWLLELTVHKDDANQL